MNTNKVTAAHEQVVRVLNGWVMLVLLIAALLADIGLMVFRSRTALKPPASRTAGFWRLPSIALPIIVVLMTGFFTLQPNQARVLVLFGAYKGTVRRRDFTGAIRFIQTGRRGCLMAREPGSRQGHGHGARRRDSAAGTKQDLFASAHAER